MKLLTTFILILSALLFVKFPSYFDSEIFKQFLESGHYFLFIGLIYLIFRYKKYDKNKWVFLSVMTLVLSLSIGLLTELIQLKVGRSFQLKDILFDVLGGFSGLLFFLIHQKNSFKYNVSLILVIFINTLIATHILLYTIINQIIIKQQYPIISNLEAPFEIHRWKKVNAVTTLSSDNFRDGQYSLKVEFSPNLHSRIYIDQLFNDWEQYQNLNFSLFNATKQNITTTLVIFDQTHRELGYIYQDRYKLKLEVKSGWNDFSIKLGDIKSSPKNRLMDMKNIIVMGFWMNKSTIKIKTTLYIDHVYLSL